LVLHLGLVLLSLAEKVASVLGCVVIVSMENYRTGVGADEGSDIDSIDFDALASNLQVPLSEPRSTCGWDWMTSGLLALVTSQSVARNGGRRKCSVWLHSVEVPAVCCC
jgi:hypothetical protein